MSFVLYMIFFFFFLFCFFFVVCLWTSNFYFTSYTRPPSTNKWQNLSRDQPFVRFAVFTIVCRKSHVEYDGWCVLYISVVSLKKKIYNFDKQNENSCDAWTTWNWPQVWPCCFTYLQRSAIWRHYEIILNVDIWSTWKKYRIKRNQLRNSFECFDGIR